MGLWGSLQCFFQEQLIKALGPALHQKNWLWPMNVLSVIDKEGRNSNGNAVLDLLQVRKEALSFPCFIFKAASLQARLTPPSQHRSEWTQKYSRMRDRGPSLLRRSPPTLQNDQMDKKVSWLLISWMYHAQNHLSQMHISEFQSTEPQRTHICYAGLKYAYNCQGYLSST